jgi:tetratricopeptide (TPR) repeat protein
LLTRVLAPNTLLAKGAFRHGEFDKAVLHARKVTNSRVARRFPDAYFEFAALSILLASLRLQDLHSEADDCEQQVLARVERLSSSPIGDDLSRLLHLAEELSRAKQNALAMQVARSVVQGFRRLLLEESEEYARALAWLAFSSRACGLIEEAAAAYAEAVPRYITIYGPNSEYTWRLIKGWGLAEFELARPAHAQELLEQALEIQSRCNFSEPDPMGWRNTLAMARSAHKDWQGAAELYSETLPAFERDGDLSPVFVYSMGDYVDALMMLEQYELAATWARKALAVLRRNGDSHSEEARDAAHALAEALTETQQLDEALAAYEDLMRIDAVADDLDDEDDLYHRIGLGRLHRRRGELESALELDTKLYDSAQNTSDPVIRIRITLELARVHLQLGDSTKASQFASEAKALVAQHTTEMGTQALSASEAADGVLAQALAMSTLANDELEQ